MTDFETLWQTYRVAVFTYETTDPAEDGQDAEDVARVGMERAREAVLAAHPSCVREALQKGAASIHATDLAHIQNTIGGDLDPGGQFWKAAGPFLLSASQ